MTKERFRLIARQCKKTGQVGIIIWPNWEVYEKYRKIIIPGQAHFEFALTQTQNGRGGTIPLNLNGPTTSCIIAVPIQKLIDSEDFLNTILKDCSKNNFEGPISYLPSNKLSAFS